MKIKYIILQTKKTSKPEHMNREIFLISVIFFFLIGCEKEESPLNDKDISSSENIHAYIKRYFSVDYSKYDKIKNTPDFIQLYDQYSSCKDKFMKNAKDTSLKFRIDKIQQEFKLFQQKYDIINIIPYFIEYENKMKYFSRVNHYWGYCDRNDIDDGAVCDTYGLWLEAWSLYNDLEYLILVNSDVKIEDYRDLQLIYFQTMGAVYGYDKMYEKIIFGSAFQISPGQINARNYDLNDIVWFFSGSAAGVCYSTLNLKSEFYNFFSSGIWQHINDSDFPSVGGGGNPAGNIQWNGSTHHYIIDSLALKLNLTTSQVAELKDANDWCDSFLEGNQFPDNAYLHAMNIDEDFPKTEAREKFERHLQLQFAKYLREGSYYDLGIALHGIADSFCPSHTGFQFYSYSLSEIINHAKWDNGGNVPGVVIYTQDVMIAIIDILNGHGDGNLENPRDIVESALDEWRDAYDSFTDYL